METLNTALEESVSKDLVGISVPLKNAKILAPIPRPKKNIFGIGLKLQRSYWSSYSKALDTPSGLPKEPVIFSKFPTAVIGNHDLICHNQEITKQLDWEAELAVIIVRNVIECIRRMR